MKKIILASTSPYRRELLKKITTDFECIAPNVDEDEIKNQIKDPLKLAQTLAKLKCEAVAHKYPEAIVIGSDQLGHLHQEILGKAKNMENAHKQLKKMNGKTHELITAVCVAHKNHYIDFYNLTKLTMRNLTDNQLKKYLELDLPFDCAGSYKLEQHGISLFSNIETSDHSAIIGLPLLQLTTELEKLGVKILEG
jgi:septum formation protein